MQMHMHTCRTASHGEHSGNDSVGLRPHLGAEEIPLEIDSSEGGVHAEG